VSAAVNRLLRRLGVPGVIGIGVLIAVTNFWLFILKPMQVEIAAERLALERLRARSAYQPVSFAGPAEDVRRFHGLFPAAPGELTGELERLHRLARAAGLDLAQGEYRLERRSTGLWAYRATLPVRGTYAELRDFLAAVLKDMPTASIDALRFERKKAVETQLDAQVRVTLHLRPPGEDP
jgi:hypothetical protein